MVIRTGLLSSLLCLAPLLSSQGVDDRPERRVADPALQNRINQAIYKGIEYLKRTQRPNGSWTYKRAQGHGGLTALSLYALAASGFRRDPAVQRGLAWIERNDKYFSESARFGTYSASLLILALTRIDSKKYSKLIRRCTYRLMAGQLRNGQWTYTLYDGKTTAGSGMKERRRARAWRNRTGDNSNSQFAVLGLWSAHTIAKVHVPSRVWRRIEGFYRRTQLKNGTWSYRPPPESVTVAGKPKKGQKVPRVRSKPSMSAAGLVSYVCAAAALEGGLRGLEKARRRPTAQLGLAAFHRDKKKWGWKDLYTTYGIERIGTVLAVPEPEWYVQGARAVVKMQRPNGSWPAKARSHFGDAQLVYQTALALLFLSKATAPAITGPQVRRG